jgi:radical SAM protein with 4Fe4S-binding SPASM domain
MTIFNPMFSYLNMETQSNCNRACWFCPRTYDESGQYFDADKKRVIKKMPMENIISILDQAQEMGFKGKVSTHHLSEPLLDKRWYEIVQEISKRDMLPVLHTNGDLFRKNDSLCEKVKGNYFYIVIGIYDQSDNEGIQKEKDFWLKRLDGKVFFSVIPDKVKLTGLESQEGAFPRTKVPYHESMKFKKVQYEDAPCHRPLERMLIHYNGKVGICCEDHESEFFLGNAFEMSLKEIWYSKRRLKVIENLTRGNRKPYDLCRNCPMPGTEAPRGLHEYNQTY